MQKWRFYLNKKRECGFVHFHLVCRLDNRANTCFWDWVSDLKSNKPQMRSHLQNSSFHPLDISHLFLWHMRFCDIHFFSVLPQNWTLHSELQQQAVNHPQMPTHSNTHLTKKVNNTKMMVAVGASQAVHLQTEIPLKKVSLYLSLCFWTKLPQRSTHGSFHQPHICLFNLKIDMEACFCLRIKKGGYCDFTAHSCYFI